MASMDPSTGSTMTSSSSSSSSSSFPPSAPSTTAPTPPTASAAQPPPPPPPPPPATRSPAGPAIAEARAAVVASIGNMVDGTLRGRAGALHAGAAAVARQGRDVARAAGALRADNDRLAREAAAAAAAVKELGNVQNWAEVLEREFLVLEETVRLARGAGASCGGSECSWSGGEGSDGGGRDDEMEGGGGGGGGCGPAGAGDSMDVDGHVPGLSPRGVDGPRLVVPGRELSGAGHVSLEADLKNAMDQPIWDRGESWQDGTRLPLQLLSSR